MLLVIILVILRLYCLIAFSVLCLSTILALIYKDQPKILRDVTIFMALTTFGIVYGSVLVVYRWLHDLSNWSLAEDPFNSFLLAILFAVASTYGLRIFKPWNN